DTGKKSFMAGSPHRLVLSVGPLQRRVNAMAATREVLIAQMGKDEDFYEMLRRKNALRMGVDGGDTVVYALSGTSRALDHLENCAEALAAGRDVEPVSVIASAETTLDAALFDDLAAASRMADIDVT